MNADKQKGNKFEFGNALQWGLGLLSAPIIMIVVPMVLLLACCCFFSLLGSNSGENAKVTVRVYTKTPIPIGTRVPTEMPIPGQIVYSTFTPSPILTPTVTPTSTPAPLAPPFEEIQDYIMTETEARWKAYLPTLKGNQVTSWCGWVAEVDVVIHWDTPATYRLSVAMNSSDRRDSNLFFDIPTNDAMTYDMGQAICFSGTIDYVGEFFGSTTVALKDVTLQVD